MRKIDALRIGPTYDNLLDVEYRLKTMKKAGITTAILSAFSDGVQDLYSCKLSQSMAVKWNNELFDIVSKHKEFKGFASLPMCDSQIATSELERCVKELGFVGGLINGPDSSGSRIRLYDTPEFDIFWDKCEELDVPIYLHPRMYGVDTGFYKDLNCEQLRGSPWGFHEYLAHQILAIIMNGVFHRHPKLKIIIGHMGEIVAFWAWRIDHRLVMEGWKPNTPNIHGITHDSITNTLRKHFYITISGFNYTPAFTHLYSVIGPSRILFATDYPMENMVNTSKWFDELRISDEDRSLIAYKNAVSLLGDCN